jgi:competence protein ComEA
MVGKKMKASALFFLFALATGSCLASVEVNTATEAELDSVKGLGPASTARILKARDQGAFKDWADFTRRVKGIKPAAAAKLSDAGLTVNQSPYTAAKAP